ncbi:MAG TPA: sugar phosphate nucleotidyltransferase [Candidatus Hydrogenedentes bacterium]|nr:sugar phosphate nucleotidyltransferase [Candidatus Hydrogenedentota bacterium]HQH54031.1 sugar phosphate nucleotidyltransferase [Candidatus Hydrogenedentota bacterium]
MRIPQTIRAAVIMAGGSGERFWPLSRRLRPKQLLCLTSPNRTLLAEAVSRVAPVVPPKDMYIVTGRHLVDPIREAGTGVPPENVIAEPCKRNTSGALAYAAACMMARYDAAPQNITMAVTTADHEIGDAERFQQTVAAALDVVERDGVLATLGVAPTRAETGYGYIQIAEDARFVSEGDVAIYPVTAFHEKPNREMAEGFVSSGRYFWNSGMFFWRISDFLDELDRVRPALAMAVRDMAEAAKEGDELGVHKIFEKLEDISIDYALMEHARRVVMARAEFPWDDIGAWPALDRTMARDSRGNAGRGEPVLIDCDNCIVYNEPGSGKVAVGVVGCEDLIVVVTSDGVLVAPKDRAQDVRLVVAELKARGTGQV